MTIKVSPSLPATISHPKRHSRSGGYDYYAGYSHSFVRDILKQWPEHTMVLDPWNGSGTTTTVAAGLDLECVGIDLNPAMIVVARSQLLSKENVASIRRTAGRLRTKKVPSIAPGPEDPLLEWFEPTSVSLVRGLLQTLTGYTRLSNRDVAHLPAEAAFWFTCLFREARRASRPWHTSNPTWIKHRGILPPVTLSVDALCDALSNASCALTPVSGTSPISSCVMLGDSTSLPQLPTPPHLVLGSPPYCTRIDYAIATRIELSVLGMTAEVQSHLRRTLIGTTTVPAVAPSPANVGPTATRILSAIRNHHSKASNTYYRKWFAQYLTAYSRSLAQIANKTAGSGAICLVVQDSHYKDIHLDLPRITSDILQLHDWRLVAEHEPPAATNLGRINPRASAYKHGAVPREPVLLYMKV